MENIAPHLMSGGTKVRSFPYKFTEEEKAQLATSAAHVFQKIDRATDEKKAIVKQHDEKIQLLKNEHALLNNKVVSGIEQRDFNCNITLDFATGKKYFYDVITGDCLGDYPLDADDYQAKLDFDTKELKAQAKLVKEQNATFDKALLDDSIGSGTCTTEQPIPPVDVLNVAGEKIREQQAEKKARKTRGAKVVEKESLEDLAKEVEKINPPAEPEVEDLEVDL